MIGYGWIAYIGFGILFGALCGAAVAKVPALNLTSKAARNLIIAFSVAGCIAGALWLQA